MLTVTEKAVGVFVRFRCATSGYILSFGDWFFCTFIHVFRIHLVSGWIVFECEFTKGGCFSDLVMFQMMIVIYTPVVEGYLQWFPYLGLIL
jgi:CDP-diacylglycerol--serine O-phosphatidyltransferase